MNGSLHQWTMDGWIGGEWMMDGHVDGCVDVQMDGLLHGWMIDGCIDGLKRIDDRWLHR